MCPIPQHDFSKRTVGRPCLLVLLAMLLGTTLYAQVREARFEHLTTDHGLSDNRVYDAIQDRMGYLWFATLGGLNRYDGYTIHTYHLNPYDTTSVASNTIWTLYEAHDGRLWVGSFEGILSIFDPLTERFSHIRPDRSDATRLSGGPITAICEDRTGAIWIGTETSGLNRIDPSSGIVRRFIHDPQNPHSLSHDAVRALAIDSTGILWVGTDAGLNRFNPASGAFTRYGHNPGNQRSLPDGNVRSLTVSQSGSLWVGTAGGGLALYDAKNDSWNRQTLNPADGKEVSTTSVSAIVPVAKDAIWLGTNHGVWKYEPGNHRWLTFTFDPLVQWSLSSDVVLQMLRDRSGNLWVCTNEGVNKLSRTAEAFTSYRLSTEKENRPVTSICESRDGTIWIASKGLLKFDWRGGTFEEFRHNPGNSSSLPNDFVTSLLHDPTGSLWLGTWGDGICRYDHRSGRFYAYRWSSQFPELSDAVNCMAIDTSSGNNLDPPSIWVGTFKWGLLRFDPASGRFTSFKHKPDDQNSLGNDRVLALLAASGTNLWIGTDGGGLNLFDNTTGRFERFTTSSAEAAGLSPSRINALYRFRTLTGQPDSVLWVGTPRGLYTFRPDTETWSRQLIGDTLNPPNIMALIGDLRGNLWASSAKQGIFRVNPHDGSWTNYSTEAGLPVGTFLRGATTLSTGEVLFGTPSGFVVFNPGDLAADLTAAPIVLTQFRVFEEPMDFGQPLSETRAVQLRHDQNYFSFEFAALNFTAPEKVQYAYRLDGFEDSWNYSGTRRFAGYTKVDPGEYTFRVKATNANGIWSAESASIAITITPPYWQTWWFRSLIAVVLAGIAVAAYNLRVAHLLALERMRNRIADDLHDEIGSDLSSIALLADLALKKVPAADAVKEQLSIVSDVSRRSADRLRDIVWLVNARHDKAEDITLRMKDAASLLLAGTSYTFETRDEKVSRVLGMEFRRQVLLMYKEILNNISKHARATKVSVSARWNRETLTLRIEDNGIGFDAETVRKGNGLRTLRERAARVGGTMSLASRPGEGTTITIIAKIT